MSTITPQKLAIYYSYPSLINGSAGNIDAAVTEFKKYHIVVLGSGLETAHPDHDNTIAIIQNPNIGGTKFYGYIDSTLSLDDIQTKIDQWSAMGVKGIFLDKFGYDFGNTRISQRQAIWSVHAVNLKAMVNAWDPNDAFSPNVNASNPTGLATRLGPNDYYLAESFAVMNGPYDDADYDSNGIKDFQDKAVKLQGYRTTYGTKIAAVATLGSDTFSQELADYSYFAAVLNGFDAWAFGEEFYSASSANLPFRTRKPVFGTKFTNAITTTGGILEHQSNVGIHIDTNAHTVANLLD